MTPPELATSEGSFLYRVVRFVPDPIRDEARNIGVLVTSADGSERASAFLLDWRGLKGLASAADVKLLRHYQERLRQLYPVESGGQLSLHSAEALSYVEALARKDSKIQVTEARPAVAANLADLTSMLAKDFVERRDLPMLQAPPATRFVAEVRDALKSANLLGRAGLKRNCTLEAGGVQLRTSFGRWEGVGRPLLMDVFDLSDPQHAFNGVAVTNVKFRKAREIRPDATFVAVAQAVEAVPSFERELLTEGGASLVDYGNRAAWGRLLENVRDTVASIPPRSTRAQRRLQRLR